VRYDILGEGPLRPALEQLVRELGLGERVTLHGARDQDEVLEMLRRSHLALAPSVTSRDDDQEGIPVSLMEAMAIGLPVVSTFHSGIPELVHDGVSGRLVPERDVDALAGALEPLVDHPETWPAMGREGRRHVVENFNLRTLNDRLVEIFRGVVADRV
jgi:colanic acid/amylovoran biosynthesis glycosyltransferase